MQKWTIAHITSKTLCLPETQPSSKQRLAMSSKEDALLTRTSWISKSWSGCKNKQTTFMNQAWVQACVREDNLKRNKKYNYSKNEKQELHTNYKEKTTKRSFLNQDLSAATYTWPRKSMTLNTICLCRTISIPQVILNGSFLECKIRKKIKLLNSISWTTPSLIVYLTMVWKSLSIPKKKQKLNKLAGLKVARTSATLQMVLEKISLSTLEATTLLLLLTSLSTRMIPCFLLIQYHTLIVIYNKIYLRSRWTHREDNFARGKPCVKQ
jgi:hypothetical protein